MPQQRFGAKISMAIVPGECTRWLLRPPRGLLRARRLVGSARRSLGTWAEPSRRKTCSRVCSVQLVSALAKQRVYAELLVSIWSGEHTRWSRPAHGLLRARRFASSARPSLGILVETAKTYSPRAARVLQSPLPVAGDWRTDNKPAAVYGRVYTKFISTAVCIDVHVRPPARTHLDCLLTLSQ